ncbi:MAG: aminopeptidase, partial [Acidobacteriota bacterium]|nr:aminopeptidase [Acidobacteriota bacterium]
MRFFGCLALILSFPLLAAAQTASPGSGVPLEIATARAANISDLRYELVLSIPEDLAAPLTGTNTLRFSLKDASTPLVIDFETSREHLKAVEANGRPSPFAYVNGHLIVPAASLVAGANTVRVTFNAGDASLNRSKDFLYTLFVPARARLALPVFDQPDLKGKWTMTLEHPAAWQSAANGAELTRTVNGTRATATFAETQPLSTYLVAFIAGDFKIETAER